MLSPGLPTALKAPTAPCRPRRAHRVQHQPLKDLGKGEAVQVEITAMAISSSLSPKTGLQLVSMKK
jgi:hypothetical protein